MLLKVQQFIQDNRLLTPNGHVIVGLSGGVDSVVLLYILHQSGFKCIAAHCNFHLRDDESDRDAVFAESFAHSLRIPYCKIDFETQKYASTQGISIEMAARELRYDWFRKLKSESQAEAITTAHHKDDSIETFLLNLTRGTGIHGLTGIKAKNGDIVRPLLCVNKKDIIAFAEKEKLGYVTDGSNLRDDYVRNKIRLNILPELQLINPAIQEAILRTMENLSQVTTIYEKNIESAKADVFNSQKNSISISKLLTFTEPQALLFEILKPFGFNSTVICEIKESLTGQSGKEFHSPSFKLIKDRSDLLIVSKNKYSERKEIYKIEKNDILLTAPFKISLHYSKMSPEFKLIKDKKIAYFDVQLLEFPLYLRHWKAGDKFIPFGMKGFKKISDYFNDKKISIPEKESVWLLCSGNDIIWILGERTDDRYKINDKTKNICTISIF